TAAPTAPAAPSRRRPRRRLLRSDCATASSPQEFRRALLLPGQPALLGVLAGPGRFQGGALLSVLRFAGVVVVEHQFQMPQRQGCEFSDRLGPALRVGDSTDPVGETEGVGVGGRYRFRAE